MAGSEYHILVIAPSGKVDRDALTRGIKLLEDSNHKVEIGPNIYKSEGPLAGTDQYRLQDLQWAMDHTSADIIWMARGGYGLTRIIDKLNPSKFLTRPKLIIGYSDITALFLDSRFEQISICHGPMIQSLSREQLEQTLDLIRKKQQKMLAKSDHTELSLNGKITGGNLSLIVNQLGITDISFFKDKILLIEEIAEYDYKIDRMLVQLIRSGCLSEIQALILGQFSDTIDGSIPLANPMSTLMQFVKGQKIPVIENVPIGHVHDNHAIMMNTNTELNYREGTLSLKYPDWTLFD